MYIQYYNIDHVLISHQCLPLRVCELARETHYIYKQTIGMVFDEEECTRLLRLSRSGEVSTRTAPTTVRYCLYKRLKSKYVRCNSRYTKSEYERTMEQGYSPAFNTLVYCNHSFKAKMMHAYPGERRKLPLLGIAKLSSTQI